MANDGSLIFDTEIDASGFKKGVKGLGNEAETGIKSVSSAIKTGLMTASKIATVAIGAAATAISTATIAGVKYNATIESYQTSFKTMTGSATKAAEVVERLKKIGAETPFELTGLADTTQLLMQYGFTADDAIERMTMLGDISQGSSEKMTRIATAYGQMSSAGKVQLEDVKQMIEAGFNPLLEISESTGESMGSLYDRISKGTISVDEITESMRRSTSEGGKFFQSMENQSKTLSGQLSTLKDNFNSLLGEIAGGAASAIKLDLLPFAIDIIASLTKTLEEQGPDAFIKALGQVLSDVVSRIVEFAPQFISMAGQLLKSLIEGLVANANQIAVAATTIITSLINAVLPLLPLILDLGLQLLMGILDGIGENLAIIIPTAVAVILKLIDVLLENAPMLLEASIELITQLALGLIDNLPILLQMLPGLIGKIISTLSGLSPKMTEVAIKGMFALATGFWTGLWDLLTQIPGMISPILSSVGSTLDGLWQEGKDAMGKLWGGIQSASSNFFSQASSIGRNIVDGLWNGISSGWTWLTNKVNNLAGDLLGGVKSVLGIHSPSKEFAKIGEFCAEGLEIGFEINNPLKDIQNSIKASLGNVQANLLGSSMGTSNTYSQVVNFNQGVQSPDEIARAIRMQNTYGLAGGV